MKEKSDIHLIVFPLYKLFFSSIWNFLTNFFSNSRLKVLV